MFLSSQPYFQTELKHFNSSFYKKKNCQFNVLSKKMNTKDKIFVKVTGDWKLLWNTVTNPRHTFPFTEGKKITHNLIFVFFFNILLFFFLFLSDDINCVSEQQWTDSDRSSNYTRNNLSRCSGVLQRAWRRKLPFGWSMAWKW